MRQQLADPKVGLQLRRITNSKRTKRNIKRFLITFTHLLSLEGLELEPTLSEPRSEPPCDPCEPLEGCETRDGCLVTDGCDVTDSPSGITESTRSRILALISCTAIQCFRRSNAWCQNEEQHHNVTTSPKCQQFETKHTHVLDQSLRIRNHPPGKTSSETARKLRCASTARHSCPLQRSHR